MAVRICPGQIIDATLYMLMKSENVRQRLGQI